MFLEFYEKDRHYPALQYRPQEMCRGNRDKTMTAYFYKTLREAYNACQFQKQCGCITDNDGYGKDYYVYKGTSTTRHGTFPSVSNYKVNTWVGSVSYVNKIDYYYHAL